MILPKKIIVIFFVILLFWLPVALDFTINIPNNIAYVLLSIPLFIIFLFGFLNKSRLLEVFIGSLVAIILVEIAMIIDANLHVEGGWLHDSVNMSWPLLYLVSTIIIIPLVFSLIFAMGSFTRKKLLKGSS